MRLALQLYSVREDMEKDFLGTLKWLRKWATRAESLLDFTEKAQAR